MRRPLETFTRESLEAALSAQRDELSAAHAAALAALRAEHDGALAAQRRELTASESSPARAAIVKAERDRIAGILDHAEAKDRTALARHLALASDMDVEAAAAMLAASAREVAASAKRHRLDAIVPRPNVGADDGEEGPMSETERGAAAFAKVRPPRA